VLAKGNQELQRLHRIGAHDLRRFCVSLAFERNLSLDQALSVGRWTGHTSFKKFYLRDMTYCRGEVRKLGPLSLANLLAEVSITRGLAPDWSGHNVVKITHHQGGSMGPVVCI